MRGLKRVTILDDSPIHLTEEGLARMREELARLKRALPERIAEAQRTAAFGDRSDNAEYKDAKGTLRRTNYRIFELEDQLKRVVIIVTGVNSQGTVQLGSTVVLETNDGQKTYEIVGPRETDPADGRISHVSPLGAALMNRKKGDSVTIQPRAGGGNGPQTYRILEIR